MLETCPRVLYVANAPSLPSCGLFKARRELRELLQSISSSPVKVQTLARKILLPSLPRALRQQSKGEKTGLLSSQCSLTPAQSLSSAAYAAACSSSAWAAVKGASPIPTTTTQGNAHQHHLTSPMGNNSPAPVQGQYPIPHKPSPTP